MTKREEAIEAIQRAIEGAPYLDRTTWDDDAEDERIVTVRQFYEGTWQGSHADALFSAVAAVAFDAAVKVLSEPDEGMIAEGLKVDHAALSGTGQASPLGPVFQAMLKAAAL